MGEVALAPDVSLLGLYFKLHPGAILVGADELDLPSFRSLKNKGSDPQLSRTNLDFNDFFVLLQLVLGCQLVHPELGSFTVIKIEFQTINCKTDIALDVNKFSFVEHFVVRSPYFRI